MNPVLKYRGGKSREIPRFLQYIPDDFDRYIEPFLGGGAVYFYLEPENAIINDVNKRLMLFYRQLRDSYPEMRAQLNELQHMYETNQAAYKKLKAQIPDERVPNENEDLYYKMRELFNHPDDSYLDGVVYFFINKTAYSGMIRYNSNGKYTDYRQYDTVKNAILNFRTEKEVHKGQYKKFVDEKWTNALLQIYSDDIDAGKTKTRETTDKSLKKFLITKKKNTRDYTDACFRYLRYTGLVSISYNNRSISFYPDKLKEVDFILATVDRKPIFIDDTNRYKEYLFNSTIPALYIDDIENVIDHLMRISDYTQRQLTGKSIEELKDIRDTIVAKRKEAVIKAQVTEIKSYALYSEIIDTYNEIISDGYYDAPLMLEYNTWRAMTMLDGGSIKGNFKFDDVGQPLSTASGNMPDIECDYNDFVLSVEVTMQKGQRQYESESEPVARHFGQMKKRTGKETYCLFIAPTINKACLAHFFALNKIGISYYGGKTKIIPLELDQFMRLIENAYNYHIQPTPVNIRQFLDEVMKQEELSTDENDWNNKIQNCVSQWLIS